jgi:hypothetical protein
MKKLFIAVMALLFMTAGLVGIVAADVNKELTFLWNQDAADLAELKEWRLYWSDTTGGPYTQVLNTAGVPIVIPYDPATGPDYTTQDVIPVPGAPGTTVRKYFVMTAVDKSDIESAFSAEAIDTGTGNQWVEIKIPMGRPFSLTVTVKPGVVP